MPADHGPVRRRPTLTDVARIAGVDISLASRVLRNDPKGFASKDTKARIMQAAEDLGYRANAAARGLRSSRTQTLGLLLPGFSSPVYAAIAHGVEERATEHGYGLVLGTHAAGDPHETLSEMLMQGRVDAMLVASGQIEDASLRRLVDRGPGPVVLVNRQVRDRLERGAARRRRRGPGGGAPARAGAPRGLRGVRSADPRHHGAQAPGLSARLRAARRARYDRRDAGSGLRRGPRRRSAAVHGRAVPDAVSVLSLHDDGLADYLVPRLSAVALPAERLGAEAVELALALLAGGTARRVVVPDRPELVLRGSTGAAPAGRLISNV